MLLTILKAYTSSWHTTAKVQIGIMQSVDPKRKTGIVFLFRQEFYRHTALWNISKNLQLKKNVKHTISNLMLLILDK